MAALRAVISSSKDPRINLALEESLFAARRRDERLLFLYSNSSSVIIGRNQNPWLECRLPLLAARGIPLYRRLSGGGTVFHDPGNVNFSYMTPRRQFERTTATSHVVRALKALGIPAYLNDRNDIFVAGKKCSGSAYRITSSGAYHHGTLLVNADLSTLRGVLHHSQLITDAAGTASVSSPVTNLIEHRDSLETEAVRQQIIATFAGEPETMAAPADSDPIFAVFSAIHDQLSTYAWTYGKTPKFTISIPCASSPSPSTLLLHIEKGQIRSLGMSEEHFPGFLHELEPALCGIPLTMEHLRDSLDSARKRTFSRQADRCLRLLLERLPELLPPEG